MLKSKERITSLCSIHNGKYITGKWGKGPYMVLHYKGYELVFDFYTVNAGQSNLTYTRMRSTFTHKQTLKFKMRKTSWLSKLLKSKSLKFDDLDIDGRYQIKGSDENLLYKLLKQGRIANYLSFNKFFNFEINQRTSMGLRCGPDESGIIFYIAGAMKDDEEISKIIDLFKVTLDTLIELNLSSGPSEYTELYNMKI